MAVIKVNDVYKKFKVYHDKGSSLKEKILFRNRNYYEERWVLNGISFEVKKGEAVGLIGHNGCGKSTLLKLLTKIIYPDSGSIEMTGRVSSLIELGAGFHPDMSGRENIYTNASIFGLTKKETDKRISDIIKFSELEEFIDNPVRTYSSGMYMRLAFAVAINVDAEILLIDEILAVGDASFQAKCFNKLREIKGKGTTIVIVSHSLGQIEQICDRSIWIDSGKIRMENYPREVHPYYLEFMGERQNREVVESVKNNHDESPTEENNIEEVSEDQVIIDNVEKEVVKSKTRWGNGDAQISKVSMKRNGLHSSTFKTGDDISIEIEYITKTVIKSAVIGIGIFRNDNVNCYGTNTNIDRIKNIELSSEGKIICNMYNISLMPGEYKLDVAIHTTDGFDYDYYKEAKIFVIYSDAQDVGVVRLNHEWIIK